MFARVKSILSVVILGAAALCASGCCARENATASSRCRTSAPNAPSCDSCCKSVGAKSSSYAAGAGCKCY